MWESILRMMRASLFDSGLIRAAYFKGEKNVELLMLMEPNNAEGLEIPPVFVAAMFALLPTVQSLLAEGLDPNIRYGSDEMSALDVAALMGNLEVIGALTENGVDVNDAAPNGETALHKAVMHGRADQELIDRLLSAGADIDARTTEGLTSLHSATYRPESGRAAAILLHRGAAKDAIKNKGESPLHRAAVFGCLTATRALLAAGADATLRTDPPLMRTPLHAAASFGKAEVVRELILHGVDLDASIDPDGDTALHRALYHNQAVVVEALLEAGASVTPMPRHQKLTPLYAAAELLWVEVMLVLLRYGAPARGLQGARHRRWRESPLHVVARKGGLQGATEAVDLLLRWGADESELNSEDETAAQVIGTDATGTHLNPHKIRAADADRVRELLANAPADRTWRRRGLLVLCLARYRTMRRRNAEVSGQGKWEEKGEVPLARGDGGGSGGGGGGGGGGNPENEGDVGDVVASLLKFEQEGVFRM